MEVTFDLDGSVVLVTGASGALGSAVCQTFSEAGGTVVGTDIVPVEDPDSLLDSDDVDSFHQADVTNEADVVDTVEAVIDRYDRLDSLANIAGTWIGGEPIEETSLESVRRLFDINLTTMFLVSKHAIPHLREHGGSIVSVSARSALEGGKGDGPYRASKAGVRLLTETIAEEHRGDIRANAIMPSVIDTPMNREMMPNADHEKWVDPKDIARVVVWLTSDGAEVTSGAAIPVYGEA